MKRLLTALAVLCCCLGLLCGCAQAGNPFAPERYLEVDGQEIPGPTWRDVEKAVEGLNGGEDSYVYLELGQPLDGVWYLSAALPLAEYEDGLGYIVDACLEEGGDYRYYECRTTDREELLSWFEDFFRGRAAPDLAGWEDITDWYDGGYDDGYPYYGYDDDEIASI